MSSEVEFILHCHRCHAVIGEVSDDEILAVIFTEHSGALCFDCDPESADTTPSIFWQWQDGDVFYIGGDMHEVQSNSLLPHARAHERTHERARARGLSSYTYLNRTQKNSAILGNGLEVVTCDNCKGEGVNPDFNEGFLCSVCKGYGTVPVAIVLPLWLIQEGENNV